jgi:hypothetical protein
MRDALIVASLAVSLFPLSEAACLGGVTGAATGDAAVARIKQAIVQQLCYDVYWRGYDYQSGVGFPLRIVIEDGTFYIRIEQIASFGPEREPVGVTFTGRDFSEHAAVLRKAVVVNGHEQPEIDQKLASGEIIEDTLTIPPDCTPRYDPPTAEKQHMLDALVGTMQRVLTFYIQHQVPGQLKYPKRLILRISNFNVDYPYAYVLVDPMRELYEVALHEPDGKDENAYQQRAEYFYRAIMTESERRRLMPKIQAHGITRAIVLHDTAGKPAAPESTSQPPAGAR